MKEETEFILQCKPNSFIEQVMFSKASLDTSGLLNHPLLFCLSPESLEEGKRFLDEIKWKGKAEDYRLTILLNEQKNHFAFSGVQLRNHLIIVAQHTPESLSPEASQVTDFLINEEVSAEFNQEKDQPKTNPVDDVEAAGPEQREVTVWDLLEELSRLNNELINTKRELVRKNMELERLQQQLKKG